MRLMQMRQHGVANIHKQLVLLSARARGMDIYGTHFALNCAARLSRDAKLIPR